MKRKNVLHIMLCIAYNRSQNISTNLFNFMFFKLNYNRHNMIKERKNGAKKLKGTKKIYVNRGPPEG